MSPNHRRAQQQAVKTISSRGYPSQPFGRQVIMKLEQAFEALTYPLLHRYHQPVHNPTSTNFSRCCRQLLANIKSLTNEENNDNMRQINNIIPDRNYLRMLANCAPYVLPPPVPAQSNISKLAADKCRVAIYNNECVHKHQAQHNINKLILMSRVKHAVSEQLKALW